MRLEPGVGPVEALELVREKLVELDKVAAEAMAQARQALGGGKTLERAELRAMNRAAALCRYIADCAHRAALEPQRRGKRTGMPLPEAWVAPMPAPASHEAAAVELLRRLPLFGEAEAGLERVGGHWLNEVRKWLEADARLHGGSE